MKIDRDVNAAINIRSEAILQLNRAGKVRIKARKEVAHGIPAYDAYDVISDVFPNREKFRDTQISEAKSPIGA